MSRIGFQYFDLSRLYVVGLALLYLRYFSGVYSGFLLRTACLVFLFHALLFLLCCIRLIALVYMGMDCVGFVLLFPHDGSGASPVFYLAFWLSFDPALKVMCCCLRWEIVCPPVAYCIVCHSVGAPAVFFPTLLFFRWCVYF